jgi:hypothetical protein
LERRIDAMSDEVSYAIVFAASKLQSFKLPSTTSPALQTAPHQPQLGISRAVQFTTFDT